MIQVSITAVTEQAERQKHLEKLIPVGAQPVHTHAHSPGCASFPGIQLQGQHLQKVFASSCSAPSHSYPAGMNNH